MDQNLTLNTAPVQQEDPEEQLMQQPVAPVPPQEAQMEQQQAPQQVAAPQPAPVEAPVEQAPQQTTTLDLRTLRESRQEKRGTEEDRLPLFQSPYSPTIDPTITEKFAARDEDPQIAQMKTQYQEYAIPLSPAFRDQNGVMREFPQGMDLAGRYNYMVLHGATEYAAVDRDTQKPVEIRDQQGNSSYVMMPVTLMEEMQRYTTPEPEQPSPGFFEAPLETMMGGIETAYKTVEGMFVDRDNGDFEKDNRRLADVIPNPLQRTLALRAIAENKTTVNTLLSDGYDLMAFGVNTGIEAPGMAVRVLAGGAEVEAARIAALTGQDPAKAAASAKQSVDLMADALTADDLKLLTMAESVSGTDIDPDVAAEILMPTTLFEAVVRYGVPEVAISSVFGLKQVSSALRATSKATKDLKTIYGTENVAEVFEIAREKHGLTPKQVMENYVTSQYGENITKSELKKQMARLDLGFSLYAARPGAERVELLRDQTNFLRTQIEDLTESRTNAVNTGNEKIARNLDTRLATLNKELQTIEQKLLVPKYLRDYAAEVGLSVGASATAQQVAMDFFGTDANSSPFVEAGAAILATAQIPFSKGEYNGPAAIAAVSRGTFTVIRELTGRPWDLIKTRSWAEMRESAMDRSLSRDAQRALREIERQGPEFQQAFMAGLEMAATSRRDLVDLSAKYGVDINVDAFSESLATLSGMAVLQNLSRQLNERATVTGLDDVTGVVLEQHNLMQMRKNLVNNLVEVTDNLLQLQVIAGAEDRAVVADLTEILRGYISTETIRMRDEARSLDTLWASHRSNLESTAKPMEINPTDGGSRGYLSVTELWEAENAKVFDNDLDPRTREFMANNPELAAAMAEMTGTLQDVDKLNRQNIEMVERLGKTLAADESTNGAASSHFALSFAARRDQISKQADQMYRDWDAEYSTATADISNFFDMYLQNPNAFLMEVTGEAGEVAEAVAKRNQAIQATSPAALKMMGYKTSSQVNTGLGGLFNEAAERTLKMFRDSLDPEEAAMFDEALGAGAPAIQKFASLRTALRSNDTEFLESVGLGGLSAEEAMAFAESMPLRISAPEWRIVNKVLNRSANVGTDDARMALASQMKKEWQGVADPESRMAFKVFDAEGNPTVLSEEAYGKFREAQTFYSEEVIARYMKDPVLREWYQTTYGARREAAAAAMKAGEPGTPAYQKAYDTFIQTYFDENPSRKPINWLGNMLTDVMSQGRMTGFNEGEALYQTVGSPLGRALGVFDPDTKRYVVLGKSADAADEFTVRAGEQGRKALLKHIQQYIINSTPGGKSVKKVDAKGNIIFDPMQELEYNREAIKSLTNIPLFERTADGKIVPMMDEFGNPKMMFTENEIYDAISLDALERNRIDFVQTRAQATDFINREVVPAANKAWQEYKDIVDLEVEVMERMSGALLGTNIRRDVPVIEQVSEAMYNKVVGADMGKEISQMKQLLLDKGYNVEIVDEFMQRAVNRHIQQTTQNVVGKFNTRTKDGVLLRDVPEVGMDPQKIYEMIGVGDPEKRRALEDLLGYEQVQTWERIADVITRLSGNPEAAGTAGLQARRASMSLDSVLSRIYNIQRGVVSPQWVATESIIRLSRQKGGKLVQAMLTDTTLANKVLDAIEQGKALKPEIATQFNRVLMTQILEQDWVNEQVQGVVSGEAGWWQQGPEFAPTPAGTVGEQSRQQYEMMAQQAEMRRQEEEAQRRRDEAAASVGLPPYVQQMRELGLREQ